MEKSKKQRYKDMISINLYPEEIEMLIKFLDYAQSFSEERDLKDDYNKAEQQQRNFSLILKNLIKKR